MRISSSTVIELVKAALAGGAIELIGPTGDVIGTVEDNAKQDAAYIKALIAALRTDSSQDE